MSSTPQTSYRSFTDARTSLKNILDTVENGTMVTIQRGRRVSVVADRDRLRDYFASTLLSRAQVVPDDSAWVVLLPDTPFAAEGSTLDLAIDDLITNLREYAAEWSVHFRHAPNHEANWALVQLVNLSDDGQLRDWLVAERA